MTTLHHATNKRAIALGFSFAPVDGDQIALLDRNGATVDIGTDPKAMLAAIAPKPERKPRAAKANGTSRAKKRQYTEEEAETLEKKSRSIVKPSYKQAYKPHHMTCGDELAKLLSDHVTVETEDGPRIDTKALRRFAKANSCWKAGYENLNAGQQRMNIGNRLRNIVKKAGTLDVVQWV